MANNNRWQAWRLHWRGIRLLAPYMPRFFAAITLHSLIEGCAPYVLLAVFSRFLGALASGADARTMWGWGGALLVAQAVFMIVGAVLRRRKEAKWEMLYRVAARLVMDQCLRLDHAALSDADTRALLDRVRDNTQALGRGLVSIPETYQQVCIGLFGTIGAVATAWRLFTSPLSAASGIVALLGHPLTVAGMAAWLAAVMALSQGLSRAAHRARRDASAEVVALDRQYYALMDVMFDPSCAADMRLYRQDQPMLSSLEAVDRAFFKRGGIKRRRRAAYMAAWSRGLTVLWLGTVYAFIGLKASGGAFNAATMVLYGGALTVLTRHLDLLCRGAEALRVNVPYLQTVLSYMDLAPHLYRGSLTTEKRADRDYEWEFRHVTFRYPGQREAALTDVSVVLRAGSCTAIVGENGSGKSTFVKLLCRMYDPDEGEILLNGIDIRKYNAAEYAALVSVVFQDFRLLPQPIGDNVAASTVYDDVRVRACLEAAGMPPEGSSLHTLLYHSAFGRGMMPSHGDAQKIAIARALYKDAPLILLDEPTAALDPIAEADIYEGFDRIVGDRTAIYISHRPASCRFCRDILVFDHGHLIEHGTHKELLSRPAGKYRALWESGAQYYHQ